MGSRIDVPAQHTGLRFQAILSGALQFVRVYVINCVDLARRDMVAHDDDKIIFNNYFFLISFSISPASFWE
jgi:hypothetical protein